MWDNMDRSVLDYIRYLKNWVPKKEYFTCIFCSSTMIQDEFYFMDNSDFSGICRKCTKTQKFIDYVKNLLKNT